MKKIDVISTWNKITELYERREAIEKLMQLAGQYDLFGKLILTTQEGGEYLLCARIQDKLPDFRAVKVVSPEELQTIEREAQRAANKIDTQVHLVVGDDCHVVYSAYKKDGKNIPIDNLDQIAIQGECVLKSFKGDWQSPRLENPTWLEVCVHANRMIGKTGDFKNVFLEGVIFAGKMDDVFTYELVMGNANN